MKNILLCFLVLPFCVFGSMINNIVETVDAGGFLLYETVLFLGEDLDEIGVYVNMSSSISEYTTDLTLPNYHRSLQVYCSHLPASIQSDKTCYRDASVFNHSKKLGSILLQFSDTKMEYRHYFFI